ncbi:MAG TPA: metalloregulator ArsR/SmtB family transcription factor, partial [Candidatus Saccharimonadales bacterium]|nr:metalloregulator ArsR/SmtB family transcription factor [Candidatus Saccharimonadales bacterium]
MVEYALDLDNVFGSLADPTRRDILQRLMAAELTIGEIASQYDLTFAAISKHLKVMEKAKLIIKQRRGKEQVVRISPSTLAYADEYLERYRNLWESRFDALEVLLEREKESFN